MHLHRVLRVLAASACLGFSDVIVASIVSTPSVGAKSGIGVVMRTGIQSLVRNKENKTCYFTTRFSIVTSLKDLRLSDGNVSSYPFTERR